MNAVYTSLSRIHVVDAHSIRRLPAKWSSNASRIGCVRASDAQETAHAIFS